MQDDPLHAQGADVFASADEPHNDNLMVRDMIALPEADFRDVTAVDSAVRHKTQIDGLEDVHCQLLLRICIEQLTETAYRDRGRYRLSETSMAVVWTDRGGVWGAGT